MTSHWVVRSGLFLLLCASRTSFSVVPLEWTQWLEVSSKEQAPLSKDFVATNPQARAMDAWLATANPLRVLTFSDEMEDLLFVKNRQDVSNPEVMSNRHNAAKALFSLSSSLRLQKLASRFLFKDTVQDTWIGGNNRFHANSFYLFFFPFAHWRQAKFWEGAFAQFVLEPPDVLRFDPSYKELVQQDVDRALTRWRIRVLREDWKGASADDVIPLLEEFLRDSVPVDDELEAFFVKEVLSRRDLVDHPEWRYWVWDLLKPLLPYIDRSPFFLKRAEKIVGLLNSPGAEIHLALVERLLRQESRALDPFIDREILGNGLFKGHPLLVSIANSTSPTTSELRHAFEHGESSFLWSPSVGRFCQAHLRRIVIRVSRRFGLHPAQILRRLEGPATPTPRFVPRRIRDR